MQRLSMVLHGTLGSYLRDALQEGSADVVARLPFPMVKLVGVFPLSFAWRWLRSTVFCKIFSSQFEQHSLTTLTKFDDT
jgi:hypothetical protein